MATPEITTGDDVLLPIQLKKNSLTFVISDTAVVKAILVSLDRTKKYNEAVIQSKDTVGAAWNTSLVVVSFPSLALSDPKFQGEAYIQLMVADTTKKSWFIKVKILKGNI